MTKRISSILAARRQVGGAVAAYNGRKFEDEIEASCEQYRRQGVACIARSHKKVAGPPGRMFPVGRGEVDFIGHAKDVPIAFDAKSCAKDTRSWVYPERDMHQLRFLKDWRNVGTKAYACIVLRCGPDIAYIINDIDTLAEGGRITLRERTSKNHRDTARYVLCVNRVITPAGDSLWPFLLVPFTI